MTPREKAEELFYSLYRIERRGNTIDAKIIAKQCALIAVDEVLRAAFYAKDDVYDYYMEVKLEIDKL